MCALPTYEIDLACWQQEEETFRFSLDDAWFASVEGAQIEQGQVEVVSVLKKVGVHYMLTQQVEGTVWLPCDRCLHPVALPVSSENTMDVRLGEEPEEDEHLLILDNRHPLLDLRWLAYEQVVLNLPLRHVHDADDECSFQEEEQDRLKSGERADSAIDPRWQALEKLKNKPK